jgi:capsular exopolysaccharide synthesis family protein
LGGAFLLGVLAQWWKVLLPVSLLLAVVSTAGVLFTFRPLYRAEAWLQIAEQPISLVFADNVKARRFLETQIELLRSPRILYAVMQVPEVARMPELAERRDPVDWLMRKGLEITPVGDSEYVSIAYSGPDPHASARLVNAVVDEYFNVRHSKKSAQALKLINLLNSEKEFQEQEVKRLRQNVRALSKHMPDVPPTTAVAGVFVTNNPLEDLHKELIQVELEVQTLEARVRALRSSIDSESLAVPEALVQSHLDASAEVQELRSLIQQKKAMLPRIEMNSRFGAQDSSYLRIQREIVKLEASLRTAHASLRPAVEEQVLAMDRRDRQKELIELTTELSSRRQYQEALTRKYEERRAELSDQGDARMELEFAQQELARGLQVLTLISERVTQMSTELKAPSRTELFQAATPPPTPVRLYPWIPLAIACVASLVVPLGLAAFWENSVRRIKNVEQLEARSEVGVLGEIARLPANRFSREHGFQLADRELGLFEESVDSLRAGLTLANGNQDLRTVAVASAVSGEGKTSVASQLAVSIARSSGCPVLLIDGDLRSPDVHEVFDMPLSPGLAEVLAGTCRFADAINRSWSEHVHVLPAGHLTQSPHKLLRPEIFAAIAREARETYGYVVIDTPPVLAASEALVIAKVADGTLVCTMRDHSREPHVRQAIRRLRVTGAEPLGVVLSGVPVRSYAYRYGSYGYATSSAD